MSRFANKLLRLAMTMSEAYSTLGVSSSSSPDEIKAAYKKKAIENHPDRGGDTAKMQNINQAKDIIDGKQRPSSGGGSSQPPPSSRWDDSKKKEREEEEARWKKDYEERRKQEEKNLAADLEFLGHIKNLLDSKVSGYKEHLLKFFDVTSFEQKSWITKGSSYSGPRLNFSVTAKDSEGNSIEVIYESMLTSMDQKHEKGYLTVSIFKDGKAVKFTKERHQSIELKDLFNPESVLPSIKMKKLFSGKVKSTTFKKSDAYMFLKHLAPGLNTLDSGTIVFPLGKPDENKSGFYLGLSRMVFMKKASWHLILYKRNGFSYRPSYDGFKSIVGDVSRVDETLDGMAQIKATYQKLNSFFENPPESFTSKYK